MLEPKVVQRFIAKIQIDQSTKCWNWVGGIRKNGYGSFHLNGSRLTHRVSYEWFVGEILEGLEIDHLCGNRACCNPDHLELVSHSVNIQRGTGPVSENAKKTHCPQGHQYTHSNTYNEKRGRQCRTCHRERQREYVNRKKVQSF